MSIVRNLLFHRATSVDLDEIRRIEKYLDLIEEKVPAKSHCPLHQAIIVALELANSNRIDPWDVDLYEFARGYLDRVSDPEGLPLPEVGAAICLAYRLLRKKSTRLQQLSKAKTIPVTTIQKETNVKDRQDHQSTSSINKHGSGIAMPVEIRLDSTEDYRHRPVSLVELLDAFDSIPVTKRLRQIPPPPGPTEVSTQTVPNPVATVHVASLDQDLAETIELLRQYEGHGCLLADLPRADRATFVTIFVSLLILHHQGNVRLHQTGPLAPISIEILNLPPSLANQTPDSLEISTPH